jgi:hypothetical protein
MTIFGLVDQWSSALTFAWKIVPTPSNAGVSSHRNGRMSCSNDTAQF